VDSTGATVTLEAPPQRIAALAPHAVEMLYALGLGDRIVATVAFADYPPAATAIPSIGDAFNLSQEALWAANPDLIVVWGDAAALSLRQNLARRAPVFVSAPRGLAGVAEELRQLAKLAPARTAASLASLERAWAEPLAPPATVGQRVLPLVSLSPPTALGPEHFFTELLSNCGARHAMPALPGIAPAVSREVLLAEARGASPPLVVLMSVEPDAAQEALPRELPLLRLNPDLGTRPGPRLFEGQRQLCELLQKAERS
jgi:iron complex transport system substrate-binding protein